MSLRESVIAELKDAHNPSGEFLNLLADAAKSEYARHVFERGGLAWDEDKAWVEVVKTVLRELRKQR